MLLFLKESETGFYQPEKFNVKSVIPSYIAHLLPQDFSHILHAFLVGVLLFTPYSRSILCTTKI